jgi:membrane protein
MIYKILPSAEVSWKDVWFGAVITSFLFTLGKLLIGIYLSHSMVSTTFGAAGSLVVLLFWIYYSAQVFFFGAELTHAYSNKFGSGNRKKRSA